MAMQWPVQLSYKDRSCENGHAARSGHGMNNGGATTRGRLLSVSRESGQSCLAWYLASLSQDEVETSPRIKHRQSTTYETRFRV